MGGSGSWLVMWLGLGAGFGLGSWLNLVRVDAATAYAYRAWYFWWRKLPPLEQLKTALYQAQAGSAYPDLQQQWTRALAVSVEQPAAHPMAAMAASASGATATAAPPAVEAEEDGTEAVEARMLAQAQEEAAMLHHW